MWNRLVLAISMRRRCTNHRTARPEGNTAGKGQALCARRLLISEYYDHRGVSSWAAQGVVKGRVWYEGVGEAALSRWEAVKTGRSHRQYVLAIGQFASPLAEVILKKPICVKPEGGALSLGRALVPINWSRITIMKWASEPLSPGPSRKGTMNLPGRVCGGKELQKS